MTIKYLIKKFYSKSRAIARRVVGYAIIYNANKATEADYNKRALLIYLTKSFLLKDSDPHFLEHQNLRQCKQIASVLGEFGYIVDVADVKNDKLKLLKKYDLIISHNVSLNGLEDSLKKDAIKLYLSSGMNHIVHNRNLRRRHENLLKRRKCNIRIKELHTEELPYVLNTDAIVGFGNEFIMNTWREVFKGPIYSFNNYGFNSTKYVSENKDFEMARRNFLFFASGSQVRKGLDLLLEIFPKYPKLHLYVCSSFETERDFCKCYYKELYKTPNIHSVGWVKMNNNQFYELARKCAYVILPSCEEGSVGSVIQCMHAGLIPIVTKESGIDTETFGITIINDSLHEIGKNIIELSELPEEWHKEHSVRTRKIAEKKFNEDAFINRWREIICQVLKGNRRHRA